MIDLDEALRDYATRWTADEPAAPDLDDLLDHARIRRTNWRHRRLIMAAAAAIAALAGVLVIAVSPHTATPAGNTDAPTAAQLAYARTSIDYAMRGRYRLFAVRTTLANAEGLTSSSGTSHKTETVWLFEARGNAQHASDRTEVTIWPAYDITINATHRDPGFGGGFAEFGRPLDLSSVGKVIDLGSRIGHAPDYRHLLNVALAATTHYGQATRIVAVLTTDHAASLAMGEASPPPASGAKVWVIQLTGHFDCTICRGPGPEPKGRYAIVVTGGGMSGDTITDEPVDLGRLGQVITLKG